MSWRGHREKLKPVETRTGGTGSGAPVPVRTAFLKGRYGKPARCQLVQGDLTQQEEDIDLLVVSTLPEVYFTGTHTFIGALKRHGIALDELAANKAEDLRATHNCWISQPLDASLPFKRVLCLETNGHESHNLVAGVFRSIIALAPDARSVAMPVLSSRAAGASGDKIMEGILRSFFAWSRRGLMIESLTVAMLTEQPDVLRAFDRVSEALGCAAHLDNLSASGELSDKNAVLLETDNLAEEDKEEEEEEEEEEEPMLSDYGADSDDDQPQSRKGSRPSERSAARQRSTRRRKASKKKAARGRRRERENEAASFSPADFESHRVWGPDESEKSVMADPRRQSLRFNGMWKWVAGRMTKTKSGKSARHSLKAAAAIAPPNLGQAMTGSLIGNSAAPPPPAMSPAPSAVPNPIRPIAPGSGGFSFGSVPKSKAKKQSSIVISFAEADRHVMETLSSIISLALTDIDATHTTFELLPLPGLEDNADDMALEAAEQVLSNATKVLAVISPAYVSNPTCLDHFNVCLYSCNEGVLVPILAETTMLPRYMTLVQYQDARPGSFRALFPACMAVTDPRSLSSALGTMQPPDSGAADGQAGTAGGDDDGAEPDEKRFDVFISYSQRFAQQARAAKEILEHLMPGVRCFLDTISLQTGGSWQKALYDSLDSSHTVLSLLSPAYFTSLFCQDEIAIAKLLDDEGRGKLFATTVVPWDDGATPCPAFLRGYLTANEPLHKCCARVIKALQDRNNQEASQILDLIPHGHHIKMSKLLAASEAFEKMTWDVAPQPTIVVVGSDADIAALSEITGQMERAKLAGSNVACLMLSDEQQDPDDLEPLENCTFIMPLITGAFVTSSACMAALHMAIFRNRTETRCLLPMMGDGVADLLDGVPSFVRLLPAVDFSAIEITDLAMLGTRAAALAAVQRFDDFNVLPIFEPDEDGR